MSYKITILPRTEVLSFMQQDSEEPRYVKVAPRSGLFFPSVDHVRTQVTKTALLAANGTAPVVVDCSHFSGIDFTASKVLHKGPFVCNSYNYTRVV